ncbi:MAG: hypothetical protein ACF8PN_00075 [Phycisphaerales bacterium]
MLTLLLVTAVSIAGCQFGQPSAGGSLAAVSIGDDPVRLPGDYPTAICKYRGRNSATILLSDRTVDELRAGDFANGQIIVLDMFWAPKAGSTPLDPTSTNCAARHIVFAGDAVGVYSGAGFLRPAKRTFGDSFSGALLDCTLELTSATDGFADRLGVASLTGRFSADRERELFSEIAIQLNSELSRRFGRLFLAIPD